MVNMVTPLYLLLLLLLAPVTYVFFRKGQTRGPRRTAAYIIQCVVILLLAVSLSGLSIGKAGDRVNVMFVMDRSDSLDDLSRSQAVETIRRLLPSMDENDTAGLVVFGSGASVEIPPSSSLEVVEIESLVDGSGSNIYAALQAALAAFPEGGENRIVLLSDGNENRGEAMDMVGLMRSSGVPVYAVPLQPLFTDNEISVKAILAPSEVRADQIHEFRVIIHSLKEASAQITLLRDGRYLGEQDIVLEAGDNGFTFNSSFASPGLHRYEIIVSSAEDTLEENNRSESFIRVTGPPSILYISQSGRESVSLLRALTAQGIQVIVGTSIDLPSRLGDLIPFDAVVLDNVPGFDISLAKMGLLERYVRDAGGGLIMLGGDSSYGVGGYYKTPVERALPVDVDAPLPVSIPSLSLIMLLDKSGSMAGETEAGTTKLDLVKEATYSAIQLLNPLHRVGLLAFDADVEWVIELTEAGEKDRIAANLFRVATGGGTDLFKAYREGVESLSETSSAIKHIIILSDGLTQKGDFAALTEEAMENAITVSTVAVGQDADRELMKNIAEWGGGRSYYTDDIRNVPKIFASETMIVSRGLISEQTFFPQYTTESEILQGIDPVDLPPLEGYVRTYLKPGARQVLTAVDGNPLLATRQYGLGRTAAFTSELGGRWGTAWLRWTVFPQFASQLMRWTQRAESPDLLKPELSRSQGRGSLVVDALDREGNFINLLSLRARLLYPDGATEEIEIPQTAPGRYSADFPAVETGRYFITLFGGNGEVAIPPESFGMVVPYPEEYADLEPNIDLLGNLASRTDGQLTNFDLVEERQALFRGDGDDFGIDRELWPLLALAALLLFVIEIAVRKVTLSPVWRDRIVRLFLRFGAPASALTYGEWEDLIEETRQKRENERRREGIIPIFKRDREKALKQVYLARLRRRSPFSESQRK